MISWDLFESKDDLDAFLSDGDIDAELHDKEKEITFPCWGFTFAYYDESTGLEILTKKDLERMLASVSGSHNDN
jgi:hypothetical protein